MTKAPPWPCMLSSVSSQPYFLSLSGPEHVCLAPRPGRVPPQQQLCHPSWRQRWVAYTSQDIADTLLWSPLTTVWQAKDGTPCSSGPQVQPPPLLGSGPLPGLHSVPTQASP